MKEGKSMACINCLKRVWHENRKSLYGEDNRFFCVDCVERFNKLLIESIYSPEDKPLIVFDRILEKEKPDLENSQLMEIIFSFVEKRLSDMSLEEKEYRSGINNRILELKKDNQFD